MLSPLAVVLTAVLLGVRHATDPDHVVAVTTIVTRERRFWRASSIGALWGVGHTATICLVGGAIVLLKLTIPPRLGLGMEFVVALMLIGLGLYNLASPRRQPVAPSAVRPVLVGMVHGLAGSAAIALLVLAAIDTTAWALAYLVIFGAGTVAGMMLVTAAIALPSLYAVTRVPTLERYLRVASGAASLAFGLFLAHQIGVVDGLFTGAPQWNPH
jgi:high-affinity nickel-transport protein